MEGNMPSWSDVLIEEEIIAHGWLQRFVIAAPVATAPLFLVPLRFWLGDSLWGLLLSGFYIFLIIMTEWSYLKASLSSPGAIPSNYRFSESVTYVFPDRETNEFPTKRHCDVCQLPKPPRTSHCKYCRRCVPKMDHHCGWTNNCVGEKNHKYFILFLFYMSLLSAVFTMVTLSRVAAMVLLAKEEWNPVHMGPGQIMATIAGLIFSTPAYIGVTSLLLDQLKTVLRNCTVKERLSVRRLKSLAVQLDDEWTFVQPYDQGAIRNFTAVFGSSPFQWLLPIANDNRKNTEIVDWPLNKKYTAPRQRKTV